MFSALLMAVLVLWGPGVTSRCDHQCSPLSLVEEHRWFALIGWILIIVLLRQTSYAIKNQLKASKAPLIGAFLAFYRSLWHKGNFHSESIYYSAIVPWADSLWHRSAGGAIHRIKPRYWIEKTGDHWWLVRRNITPIKNPANQARPIIVLILSYYSAAKIMASLLIQLHRSVQDGIALQG